MVRPTAPLGEDGECAGAPEIRADGGEFREHRAEDGVPLGPLARGAIISVRSRLISRAAAEWFSGIAYEASRWPRQCSKRAIAAASIRSVFVPRRSAFRNVRVSREVSSRLVLLRWGKAGGAVALGPAPRGGNAGRVRRVGTAARRRCRSARPDRRPAAWTASRAVGRGAPGGRRLPQRRRHTRWRTIAAPVLTPRGHCSVRSPPWRSAPPRALSCATIVALGPRRS